MQPRTFESIDELHGHVKKESLNKLGSVGLRALSVGLVLGAATILHMHPDITFFGGLGNEVYNGANIAGEWIGTHVMGTSFLPDVISHIFHDALPSNLLVDFEVPTTLAAVSQGLKLVKESHGHYDTHAHEVAKNLQSGKAVDNVPAHVTTAMTVYGLLKGGLTLLDVGVETVETVVDGPIPYGAKDLDAAAFLALNWHPLTGKLNKGEKIALGIGAFLPYIPPLFVLAPYVFLEHIRGKK